MYQPTPAESETKQKFNQVNTAEKGKKKKSKEM